MKKLLFILLFSLIPLFTYSQLFLNETFEDIQKYYKDVELVIVELDELNSFTAVEIENITWVYYFIPHREDCIRVGLFTRDKKVISNSIVFFNENGFEIERFKWLVKRSDGSYLTALLQYMGADEGYRILFY